MQTCHPQDAGQPEKLARLCPSAFASYGDSALPEGWLALHGVGVAASPSRLQIVAGTLRKLRPSGAPRHSDSACSPSVCVLQGTLGRLACS